MNLQELNELKGKTDQWAMQGKMSRREAVAIADLVDEVVRLQTANEILHNGLNNAWAVLYPDNPDGWEYAGQVGNHIRVEVERLRVEVRRLEDARDGDGGMP